MNSDVLARATDDIRELFGVLFADFQARWCYIATWHRVTFYGNTGYAQPTLVLLHNLANMIMNNTFLEIH